MLPSVRKVVLPLGIMGAVLWFVRGWILAPLRPLTVMAASAPPLHRGGGEWPVRKAERTPVLREAQGKRQKQTITSALLHAGPGLCELTRST